MKFPKYIYIHILGAYINMLQTNKKSIETIYFGVRSTFVHMYLMSGDTILEQFKIELSQFMSRVKRTVASQKAESGEIFD